MMAIQQKGSKKNGFTAWFDHGNQIGFETDGTHGHDDKEFGELFERGEEATSTRRERWEESLRERLEWK